MSRIDQNEYDSPPGLGFMRNSAEREALHSLHRSSTPKPSFTSADRRTSGTLSNYPLYTSTVPRSAGVDWEPSSAWDGSRPNTNNAQTSAIQASTSSPFSLFNHHHPSSSPSSSPLFSLNDRVDRDTFRATHHSPPAPVAQPVASNASRSTLWWGELESWMDEEYAKQVCSLMSWDPIGIKVPHPAPDPATGQQANNPGYCFLTFPTPAHAASVLSQVNSTNSGSSALTMPNSTKPFVLNWASSVPSTTPVTASFPAPNILGSPQYPKEYSIFVGDLAPETSNSDLVAVFRNPVLGLRSDREPKFIRPFLSCKSAKIMLDPVTGVSRGYGFVRFTDEKDQQRALVEMHGLYCLSRPMRISPATAKFKPPPMMPPHELPQVKFPLSSGVGGQEQAFPPLFAATTSNSSLNSAGSGTSIEGSSSGTTLSSGTGSSSSISSSTFSANTAEDLMNLPDHVLAQIAQHLRKIELRGQQIQVPTGEQLTSTDPYNTTVFVGGLSPLISEDTLRTFFAPFGDIHYVKVPVGKHCGFVQFVRKSDAERAIEKMQGFPVGGSRIRLSWGRSQYKAAQAAAQAAQTAALQSQMTSFMSPLSSDQAVQVLSRLGYLTPPKDNVSFSIEDRLRFLGLPREIPHPFDTNYAPAVFANEVQPPTISQFAPFSARTRPFASGFYPMSSEDVKGNETDTGSGTTVKPSSAARSGGSTRYGPFLSSSPPANRAPGRPERPISRPSSGQTSAREIVAQELDAMHDLNGTLASLDLDRDRPWKSPAESSDSGGSVQFQLTMNGSPSP
ncbi:uncharacterized protein EV420DRAFT_1664338 [Desarmillaria tabescens]|uniref:RRM domain-containing protein n=1 Tax=Armillaria tabescens TaxID=1929756 RepID=A0AA39N9N6_ARMTA|nr:uncharacterized protein EV420DRAFT_1664338 [Desarmillaria tabescens]KAK0461602.1 hypothetical protein EV420DRAFT_1664338 [Desarmillaria tabescens]